MQKLPAVTDYYCSIDCKRVIADPENSEEGWKAQGGYSGFQVTGMIEGFFGGLKFFDSGIFLGTKIWQEFFWVG